MNPSAGAASAHPVRVDFHTGIDDVTSYACAWLRKALRAGQRVRVEADPLALDLLDKALWTFDPQEFLPHLRLRAQQPLDEALQATPIWLADPQAAAPEGASTPHLLLRLLPEQAWDRDEPARVVELVGTDADDIRQARARWRDYQSRGWQTTHHERRSAPDARDDPDALATPAAQETSA